MSQISEKTLSHTDVDTQKLKESIENMQVTTKEQVEQYLISIERRRELLEKYLSGTFDFADFEPQADPFAEEIKERFNERMRETWRKALIGR